MANVGQKAPNFNLRNANKAHGGETMSLDDARGENGTIVVFECNHCPYVIASIGRMEDMAVFAKQSNVGFIGINSNDPIVYVNDDFEHMVKRADSPLSDIAGWQSLSFIVNAFVLILLELSCKL